MGLFDGFLSTATKAFDWLGSNKTALSMLSGAAQGYGAYMTYKQQNEAAKAQQKAYDRQYELDKRKMDTEESRYKDTHGVINAYDKNASLTAIPVGNSLTDGSLGAVPTMVDALKNGGKY